MLEVLALPQPACAVGMAHFLETAERADPQPSVVPPGESSFYDAFALAQEVLYPCSCEPEKDNSASQLGCVCTASLCTTTAPT